MGLTEKPLLCPKCRAPNPKLTETWKDHYIVFEWVGDKYDDGILEPGNPCYNYTTIAHCWGVL
jgi:hypothetical protein